MPNHLFTEIDADGIATLTWNTAGNTPNVFNDATLGEFEPAIRELIANPAVKGIVIASAKSDFIVGADLTMLQAARKVGKAEFLRRVRNLQQLFRDIETGGKPVVAAINGTAVGGGCELAMACHARVSADDPALRIGQPEVQLGLLPGAGGTQRLPRLIGIREAPGLINQGKNIPATKALELGLVTEVVPKDQLLARAKQLARSIEPVQPWDKKGFKLPGGEVQSPGGAETFIGANAMITRETWGNYPAPRLATYAVYHGCQMPIDQGLKVEARGFVELVFDQRTQNMIRTLFFSMGEANRLKNRPKDVPTASYRKIGVVGAGLMGHGIAHAAALNGIEVTLLDLDRASAEKGKQRVGTILADAVKKGRLSQSKADAALARVTPTDSYRDFADCDPVIEAVFEKRELKVDVIKQTEAVVSPTTIFGSNTSTLPITGLARASTRPDQFIGLHFFSPVEKMPLVEVILGEQTSQATLARSLDFVRAIGKTPIVVRDGRGFFTSRVFGTYLVEGVAMLGEGVHPALIDNAGRLAGMAMGSLTVADMVNIDLSHKIRQQTKADLGDKYVPHPSEPIMDLLVSKGRYGQKTKAGFFDYPDTGEKRLWPEITTYFPTAATQPELGAIKRRLLHIQAIETLRCIEEGIVTRPQDADVGSILGWGFCPFYGGVASYIDYVGAGTLERECDQLADRHGERFRPPGLLRTLAKEGRALYANAM
jgi:3-hydroxyacyl-CoA dehydrogenase/enoyl-CoA hydratase/3-hydroxybutyryl-CoA epimerase